MKKYGIIIMMGLIFTGQAVHALSTAQEFEKTLREFEATGGTNEDLQKKLCGLGVTRLNQLREQVLADFPALKQKKQTAEFLLSRLARSLRDMPKNSKEAKRLKSQKAQVLERLTEIEDEIEARLHDRPALSKEFDKIHDLLKEWCD